MPETIYIGKVMLRFRELTSTNDFARAWVAGDASNVPSKSRPPEGAVVWAVSQSAGRGQFGSKWVSAAGENLTFSVILYPEWLGLDQQFLLSQAVAVAISDAAAALLPEAVVRIKWPNDIYVDGRKIAGVLIENVLSGSKWQSAVVGIGLNVNQQAFPPEAGLAVSLAQLAGRALEVEPVLDRLLERLEFWYQRLKQPGAAAQLQQAYLERLYRLNEPMNFEEPGAAPFAGAIRGVSASGMLLVETAGTLRSFQPKAIRYR
jgi:BirA family transcriptional regulator, biotin operon repressor / biotin---[acetyl-CoA-carboxylase] ligase